MDARRFARFGKDVITDALWNIALLLPRPILALLSVEISELKTLLTALSVAFPEEVILLTVTLTLIFRTGVLNFVGDNETCFEVDCCYNRLCTRFFLTLRSVNFL